MDRVEERGETVDLEELARKRGRKVEPESVDVALRHEVPKRVHDQPQHGRMHRIQRIARSREVHVVPQVLRHQAVVALVVDAPEREHRPEVVSLGGVVVDHVEDHLDAGLVECLDHALELTHLLAVGARRCVEGVRCEVADRRVSPVVRKPAIVEEALVGDVVDGEQLDGVDAQLLQVLERRLGSEPGIRAA